MDKRSLGILSKTIQLPISTKMELPKVENGTWYANGGLILKNCSTRIFVGFDIFHSPQPPTDSTIFVFNLNGTSFPEPDFALTPVL